MNELIYQAGEIDEMRHRYHYDANNRLVRAFTSRDDVHWEMDAKYFYYLHGSLARVETGHDKVQGTDYAYNLQGWLKGVNSATLNETRDIGKDGKTTGINRHVGADAFGFQLGYYAGDYTPINNNTAVGTNTAFANTTDLQTLNDNATAGGASMGSLYNGNITHMVTALRDELETIIPILGNNYQYDQLQRIREMKVYEASNLQASNTFAGAALYGNGAYSSNYTFDRNGNLKTLSRFGAKQNGAAPVMMDNFVYHYENGVGGTTTDIDNFHPF